MGFWMFNPDRILILSPHPDDEVLWSGGLIAYALKNQIELFIMYFSSVLLGIEQCKQVTGKIVNTELRQKEIEAVSKLGGFDYTLLSFPNNYNQLDITSCIENRIELFKPDVVCIPYRNSFNQDHRTIFSSAITALRPVPKNFKHFPKFVLECEESCSWTTQDSFKPNFYLPMSKEDLDFKISLIKLHKSQIRNEPSVRSLKNIKRMAQMRGCEIGESYSECYSMIRGVV